ncbi:MAG: hypothetical protein LBF19_03250 [Prevotellaceae bacterium]|jgi:hypothetical protein|nr:hypothetical protein [Prevotellaceae bacterium]
MKKIFVTIGIALCAMNWAAAQEEDLLTTDDGTVIVPQQGSFAFGIDATPVLKYVGGLFSDNGATVPTFKYAGFYGKYFLADNLALRGKLRLWYNSNEAVTLVTDAGNADKQVENKTTTSNMDVNLIVGIEKRIGKTRLQGFYGAELTFGTGFLNNISYTYGNPLSASNPGHRPLSSKGGTTFLVGAAVFTGAEYFIAPGIAIGGELGWGIAYNSKGRGEQKTESWNNSSQKIDTVETGGSSSFNFNNFDGSFTLTFYF